MMYIFVSDDIYLFSQYILLTHTNNHSLRLNIQVFSIMPTKSGPLAVAATIYESLKQDVPDVEQRLERYVIEMGITALPLLKPFANRNMTKRWMYVTHRQRQRRIEEAKCLLASHCYISDKRLNYSTISSISAFDELTSKFCNLLELWEDNAEIRNINVKFMWVLAVVLLTIFRQRRATRNVDHRWHPFVNWGEFHILMKEQLNLCMGFLAQKRLVVAMGYAPKHTLFGKYSVPDDLDHVITTMLEDSQVRMQLFLIMIRVTYCYTVNL